MKFFASLIVICAVVAINAQQTAEEYKLSMDTCLQYCQSDCAFEGTVGVCETKYGSCRCLPQDLPTATDHDRKWLACITNCPRHCWFDEGHLVGVCHPTEYCKCLPQDNPLPRDA